MRMLAMRLHAPTKFYARRCVSTFVHSDIAFESNFLSGDEQRLLLNVSLQKLDSTEPLHQRRRRRKYQQSLGNAQRVQSIQDLFLPDEYYHFEAGHYDGVIKNYREMHVSTWPEAEVDGLSSILSRLHAMCPSTDIQTHLLHLASDGEIFPHVDNIAASGSWILGVSLGAERILRLEPIDTNDPNAKSIDISLPSGSLYIQKDALRYQYKHSVLKTGILDGRSIAGGQRVSIMIRDRKPTPPL